MGAHHSLVGRRHVSLTGDCAGCTVPKIILIIIKWVRLWGNVMDLNGNP